MVILGDLLYQSGDAAMAPEKKPRNGERKQEPSPRERECTVSWKLIHKDKDGLIIFFCGIRIFLESGFLFPVNFHLITSVQCREGTERCKHHQQHCMSTHAAGAVRQHSCSCL